MREPCVWGIHAGANGEAESLFRDSNTIAIGWDAVGDLKQLNGRDAFEAALKAAYPKKSKGAAGTNAGILLRFARKMQIGDYVVDPRESGREVWVGCVTGDCQHCPKAKSHRNRREVEWRAKVSRDSLTQGALQTIQTAFTLFQIQKCADEFVAIAEGAARPRPEDDVTLAGMAERIEKQTRDFVIKQIATHLKGDPFEELVADILEAMGYRTRVSAPGPDHGVDILAHPDELGFGPPRIKVQVKSSGNAVSEPVVAQLYGILDNSEFGLFVTLGSFSDQAKAFAVNKSNLRLVDGEELVRLLLEHYDALDSRHKGIIPLKQAYIPEVLDDGPEMP